MKLSRYYPALALTVASAFALAACGDDTDTPDTGVTPNDTGVNPFDSGPGTDIGPSDMGTIDTGLDGGGADAADVPRPDDGGFIPPCPVGTEGCTCTSTSVNVTTGDLTLPLGRADCNAGMICAPWDALSGRNFDANPDNDLTGAVQSCLKTCTVDADCGAGRACQDSFFVPNSGIQRYCVDTRADYGQFCGTNKLTISRLPGVMKETDTAIGCPVGTNCQIGQFSDVHPDEGLCLEFCTEREPNCPVSAPVCNPRIFSSTSTTDPFVGVCAESRRGPGSPCFDKDDTYVGLVQICDTTGGAKVSCIGGVVDSPNQGGVCIQRCDAASPCLADPSGLPVTCSTEDFFNPSTPPQPVKACNVGCSSFPESCPATGGPQGQGWFCTEFRAQTTGAVAFSFCIDRYPNPLSPGTLDAAGMLATEGDDCLGDLENYGPWRCPVGSHCEGLGDGTGACLYGCSTASATTGDTLCNGVGSATTVCVDGLLMGTDPSLPPLGFCGG